MSVTIFRNKVAMGINTTLRDRKYRVFLSIAHLSDGGDYKFNWRDSVNIALNEYEISEIVTALHKFNSGEKIEGILLHHESQNKNSYSKEMRVFHPKEKESKKVDTSKLAIWMDEVRKKGSKMEPLKTGGIITLSNGEALFLERYLSKSIDYYIYDMIENSINYAGNGSNSSNDEDDTDDEDDLSSDDIPDDEDDDDPFSED